MLGERRMRIKWSKMESGEGEILLERGVVINVLDDDIFKTTIFI